MTPILANGRKPGASHSLLHGCCWLHFPAISGGRKGDGSSVVWGERDVFVMVPRDSCWPDGCRPV